MTDLPFPRDLVRVPPDLVREVFVVSPQPSSFQPPSSDAAAPPPLATAPPP
eukprot:CAMPEP_0182925170 /NCGR_PEP_ID=MMETSP0105_2-20130417/8380_1 /TAXON_ID=81532 ORGANISM="Acanthoeca-like sp., Strain 10tr" /NCGR_SAMPLE_ID=MMETSP0105_2 /ASSEMBLY_ACC=CAM_ASM_000205 /LENGTH=50 /DNA_ID=CAMNT_0025063003 /DNA_START=126 /DNA_END=274 /DNA_ORIENTATION=-